MDFKSFIVALANAGRAVGRIRATWSVIAGSGTGDLCGLKGEGAARPGTIYSRLTLVRRCEAATADCCISYEPAVTRDALLLLKSRLQF